MIEIKFPTTVIIVSERTGIPERTVRLYCEELNLKKHGRAFLIYEDDYKSIMARDLSNRARQKQQRKYKLKHRVYV